MRTSDGVKSLATREFGPPSNLKIEYLPRPVLAPDEVRLQVAYAGINFPDALVTAGEYQEKRPFPIVPGSECSGVVIEVGSSVNELRPGDRVLALPMRDSMAEELVVRANDVFVLPDSVSLEQAAAFPITYGTVRHALADRGDIQAGDLLMVNGAAGGIGSAAVALGKHFGATVVAIVGSEQKKQFALAVGADHAINYKTEDVRATVRALTNGRGVDLVCDPVGGTAFADGLSVMAWEGRLLVVGFTSGSIPQIPANHLLLKGCAAVGVYWGRLKQENLEVFRSGMIEVIAAFAAGSLPPLQVSAVTLEEVPQVLDRLQAKKAFGKYIAKM